MPSGAKKRKAAKKKKEKETEINTNPSTTNPQGNDEVKSQSQDEKGSDGGEGGSPAHGEHDPAFNEEEEERDPSAAQPSHAASSSKDLEEAPGDAKIDETEGRKEGIVVIQWDMKSEGSESKDVIVGHVESAKESDHGNGNRNYSSSSSSDETGTLKNSKNESHNSVNETVGFDELVKTMDSLHAKMTSITQNVLVEETGDSVVESSADIAKVVAAVPEVQTIDNNNALLEKSTGSQVEATYLAVEKNEDKEHSSSDENVRTISLEEPKPREFDSEVSASVSQSPIPESTIDAEHVKDSDTPECSDNQPLVASVPPVVQKTSWLSCCGLFDVLSGSNR
ncbi:hypothetical protein AAZX31_09G081300 [Glycine max]|uniref:Uncharacterized protein n=2 Tax=Glycine subgen. Soja TaxID=1462606 RepID=I1L235_SOYBN|nr:uncharacterized protein LOC100781444 [Glycine max]XP_028180814.1 uncharacterized protein LOC114367812 [Glycine soja]XP_028180815.1 uncharacterized protein LOC114367812 [Glycine soja]XP_040860820.1 uncharacterized protein LOC100781444 [Glycine max]KAG4990940.1 hypothetical protein JHK87_024397 [Glycine soja]KAG5006471.1 hypothetical protein JHK85_025013 [Glycine max]KAG5012258.1 hypothetical protein JHK86_024519 [Glycine max]KAG5133235.1 hypothetical protein JHK82_024423 [Glycine max]KAH1|eukprot:XP_003533837.1 uncharacterized protein LOC100781444 [Glycine max]